MSVGKLLYWHVAIRITQIEVNCVVLKYHMNKWWYIHKYVSWPLWMHCAIMCQHLCVILLESQFHAELNGSCSNSVYYSAVYVSYYCAIKMCNINHRRNKYKANVLLLLLSSLVTQKAFAMQHWYITTEQSFRYIELTDAKFWISKNASLCLVFANWVTNVCNTTQNNIVHTCVMFTHITSSDNHIASRWVQHYGIYVHVTKACYSRFIQGLFKIIKVNYSNRAIK